VTRNPDLAELRSRIQDLDRAILEAAAERTRLAREVAEIKIKEDLPTVDYAQERRVLGNARLLAEERGVEPDLAEDLLARLIQASVTEQEAERLRHTGTGAGRTAVVVGGAGRMGRWMVRFLRAQQFKVDVVDPAAPEELDRSGRELLPSADLIICAVPPRSVIDFYRSLKGRPPVGLVCDIASIKTPLIDAITELQDIGVRVGSFHPMFGPTAVLLRGEDVVVCDTGDREGLEDVCALFAPTTARIFKVDLEEHDRLMAEILALAHATTLAFSVAQRESHVTPVHSTTYRALEELATSLAQESPDVYFEIQADNPHAAAAVERLGRALERLTDAVSRRDREAFGSLMRRASAGADETSK
jgi:chorismate mutase/prephenate dehydrogenase